MHECAIAAISGDIPNKAKMKASFAGFPITVHFSIRGSLIQPKPTTHAETPFVMNFKSLVTARLPLKPQLIVPP
jgi:hypothetical protein